MRKAIFITGFNNWGKTTIINELFNRNRYDYGWPYRIKGVDFNTEFTVEAHSNYDYPGQGWMDQIMRRIDRSLDNGQNLFTALYPTLDNGNNFTNLLQLSPFSTYDRLYIFLIENKWEHHAKLKINNIIQASQDIPNATFITINADQNLISDQDRRNAKINQIRNELNNIFS
ncbi:MAG TPA: hypothetical protein VNW99_10265 [Cytophagaceae bacterium]|jgi:hypothetical protein|nr:hypothetical protein [Cytophagaceae bacterium]